MLELFRAIYVTLLWPAYTRRSTLFTVRCYIMLQELQEYTSSCNLLLRSVNIVIIHNVKSKLNAFCEFNLSNRAK